MATSASSTGHPQQVAREESATDSYPAIRNWLQSRFLSLTVKRYADVRPATDELLNSWQNTRRKPWRECLSSYVRSNLLAACFLLPNALATQQDKQPDLVGLTTSLEQNRSPRVASLAVLSPKLLCHSHYRQW
eukprot:4939689-Amphidinium_carterae.1